MSCFWSAIYSSLDNTELKAIGLVRRRNGETDLIKALKKKNTPCLDVLWMGKPLSRNQIRETYKWVNDYSENGRTGHLTSACDPFLSLLVQIFKVHVEHFYVKSKITYTRKDGKHRRSLLFKSSKTHFMRA